MATDLIATTQAEKKRAPQHVLPKAQVARGAANCPFSQPANSDRGCPQAQPPDIGAGVAGGIPGGVPGGQLGGVIGGIISGGARTYVPVPTLATSDPRSPIRVGGRVRPPRAFNLLPSIPPWRSRLSWKELYR